MGAFAVLSLAFVAQPEPAFAQTDPDWQDVRVTYINDNDINCHKAADRATQPYMQNGTINWNVQVVNNGPGSAFLEKAAFHNPTAGCVATSDALIQQTFTMAGKTNYGQGETGNAFFSYNLNAFNCGRVQVDAAYRNSNGSGAGQVFLGEVIDYGVDCPLNRMPIGNLDSVTCAYITGWGGDPDDVTASSNYGLTIGGPIGVGTTIAFLTTDILRDDVNTTYGVTGRHGFQFAFPASFKDGRTHAVYAYIQDNSSVQFTMVGQLSLDTSTCTVIPPVVGRGTVMVTSNIPTTWAVYGPQNFLGTGTSARYDAAAGTYTLANMPANLVYNSQEYQLSSTGNPVQALAANASITFAVTYAAVPPTSILAAPRITAVSNAQCAVLRVTWQDNSDNESGFYVYRSDGENNGDYTRYQRIATLTANSTSYVDSPALNRSYFYIVAAYIDSTGRIAASAPFRSAFNMPCLSNLSGDIDIVAINGQANANRNSIKDNDTLTIQIAVDNSGPADAYVTRITDQLGIALRNPRNIQVTGPGANLASPAITGSEPDVTFNVSGRKTAGGNRWIILFDATVELPDTSAMGSVGNCATVHYFDDGGDRAIKLCLDQVLGRSVGGGGINFREVAP